MNFRSPLFLLGMFLTFVFAGCAPSAPPGTDRNLFPLETNLELSATPFPSKLNETVVLTARITPTKIIDARPTMGGTVTFTDKTTGSLLCNASMVNNETHTATCETKFTKSDNHNLEAVYSGYSENNVHLFQTSTGVWTQEISNKFRTQIVLAQSVPTAENPIYGDVFELRAKVKSNDGESSSDQIRGDVIFKDADGVPLNGCEKVQISSAFEVENGVTCAIQNAPNAVKHSYQAQFISAENSNYHNSDLASVDINIDARSTNLSLTTSQTSIELWQSITLNASVVPDPTFSVIGENFSAITGKIIFKNSNGTPLVCDEEKNSNDHSENVNDGQASCTLALESIAPNGIHFTAAYIANDNSNYQSSPEARSAKITVNPISTSLSLSSQFALPHFSYADPIELVATVNRTSAVGGTLNGTVEFKEQIGDSENSINCDRVELKSDNKATCNITVSPSVGGHNYKASFKSSATNYQDSILNSDLSVQVTQRNTQISLSPNQNPIILGQTVILTATLAPNPAIDSSQSFSNIDGNVIFENSNGVPIECEEGSSQNIHYSQATCYFTPPPHNGQTSFVFKARYEGNSNYIGSSTIQDTTITVNLRPTTVFLQKNEPFITLGQSVTLTANVLSTFTQPVGGQVLPITGSVVFKYPTGLPITCENRDSQIVNEGQATCTFKPKSLIENDLKFTAAFTRDALSNYADSPDSNQIQVVVNSIPTTISVGGNYPLSTPSDGANVPYGDKIELIASVSGANEFGKTLNGTVVFKEIVGGSEKSINCEQSELIGNFKAICTVKADGNKVLSVGTHTYTAKFKSLVSNYADSNNTSTVIINVQPRLTKTSLQLDRPSLTIGQTVSLYAIIAPNLNVPDWGAGFTQFTGTVAFTDLNDNPISCESGSSDSHVRPGARVICKYKPTAVSGVTPFKFKVVYSGDSNYAGSTSDAQNLTVVPVSTTSVLMVNNSDASVTSIPYAEEIRLYANLRPAQELPTENFTGTMTFYDGQNPICENINLRKTLEKGVTVYVAVCNVTNVAFKTVGQHVYRVIFNSGNQNYGSSSGDANLTITPKLSAVNLTIFPAINTTPLTIYDTIELTAKVDPSTYKGTISFNYDSQPIQNCQTQALSDNGTVTCTTTLPTSGRHVLKAIYTPSSEQQYTDGAIAQQEVDISATQVNTPNSAIYIVTGSGRVAISTNAARTWMTSADVSSAQNPNDKILSFAVTPTGNIYVGTQNGYVFVSTDKGMTWRMLINSLVDDSRSAVNSLIMTAQHELIAGLENGKIKKSRLSTRLNEEFQNSGWEFALWNPFAPSSVTSLVGSVLPNDTDKTKVLAVLKNSTVAYSAITCGISARNQAVTLQDGALGMQKLKYNNWDTWDDTIITSAYIGGDDSDQAIYFGTKTGKIVYLDKLSSLFKNDGTCNALAAQSFNFLSPVVPPVTPTITGIFVAPGVGSYHDASGANTLKASTVYILQDKKVHISKTHGRDWYDYYTPDKQNARAIFVAPILYATTGNAVDETGAIKISKDNGKSWIPLNSSGTHISNLFVLPQSGTIFVTKDDTKYSSLVFASANGGVSWVPRSNLNNLLTAQQLTDGGAPTALWVDATSASKSQNANDNIQNATLALGFANGANLLWTGTGVGGATKKWTLSTPSDVLYSDRRMNVIRRINAEKLMFAANPENGLGRSGLINLNVWSILNSATRPNGWQSSLGADQVFVGHNDGLNTLFRNENQVYSLGVNQSLGMLYIGKNYSSERTGINGITENHILKSTSFVSSSNRLQMTELKAYPPEFWKCPVMSVNSECISGWSSMGIPISLYATPNGTLYVYMINTDPNENATKSILYTTTDDGRTWQPFTVQPYSKADGSPQDGVTIKGYGTVFANYQYSPLQ